MSDTYYIAIAVILSLFVLGLLISSGVITYRQVISMALFVVMAPAILHILLMMNIAIAGMISAEPSVVVMTLFNLLYMLFIIPVAIAIELKWYILAAIIAGVLLRTSTS